MKRFLIDANLPFKVKIWQNEEFEFVILVNDEWSDSEIWDYALANDLIIITKDSDFSHRLAVNKTSPKIIHIKIGNLKLKDFDGFLFKIWPEVEKLCDHHRLINIFFDRIEAIK